MDWSYLPGKPDLINRPSSHISCYCRLYTQELTSHFCNFRLYLGLKSFFWSLFLFWLFNAGIVERCYTISTFILPSIVILFLLHAPFLETCLISGSLVFIFFSTGHSASRPSDVVRPKCVIVTRSRINPRCTTISVTYVTLVVDLVACQHQWTPSVPTTSFSFYTVDYLIKCLYSLRSPNLLDPTILSALKLRIDSYRRIIFRTAYCGEGGLYYRVQVPEYILLLNLWLKRSRIGIEICILDVWWVNPRISAGLSIFACVPCVPSTQWQLIKCIGRTMVSGIELACNWTLI